MRIRFWRLSLKRREKVNESLIEHFEELKVLVETLQKDVVKNSQGNKSAGVRARKGLRQVKKMATDIVRLSLETDKS